MGSRGDDLPEIEIVDEQVGQRTTAGGTVQRGSGRRVALLTGVAVLGISAALWSLWGDEPNGDAASTSSTTSTSNLRSTTTVRGDASGAPATDDDGQGDIGAIPIYDLELPGARLKEDSGSEPRWLAAAVWTDGTAYVTLSEQLGPRGATFEADTPVDWLAPSGGAAWIGIPSDEPTARLHWVRSSAMPLAIRAYWTDGTPSVADREDALRNWVQGINPEDSGSSSYVLEDPEMQRIAANPGGDRRSRARVWDLGGVEILVFVSEDSTAGGLTNLFATGSVERVTIPGVGDVWLTDTEAGWQVRHDDREFWVTVSTTEGSRISLERILQHLRGPPSSGPSVLE